MLQHELIKDAGILIIEPQGKLKQEDFAMLASIIDPWIEQHGKLKGLMIYAPSFPGWHSMASLWSHIAFVKRHHHHVEKVAAVTFPGLLSIMPKLVGPFVKAQVKHFDYEQKAQALAWLKH